MKTNLITAFMQRNKSAIEATIAAALMGLITYPLGQLLHYSISAGMQYLLPHLSKAVLQILLSSISAILILVCIAFIGCLFYISYLKRQIKKLSKPSRYRKKFCVLWDENDNPACPVDYFSMYLYSHEKIDFSEFYHDKLGCSSCSRIIPLMDENGLVLTLEEARGLLLNNQSTINSEEPSPNP